MIFNRILSFKLIRLFGISPFYEEEKQDTYTRITKLDYDIDCDSTNQISDDARDFIQRLLVKDIRFVFVNFFYLFTNNDFF